MLLPNIHRPQEKIRGLVKKPLTATETCFVIYKACDSTLCKIEMNHTSVFEMFRWETIPEVKLYVAVSVFWPALPAKVLAAHDDHTNTFPVE